ncbi:DUF1768 domain-containing protein [Mycena indigotica]|uniref:DUF1768 domain-containing protein n=1 Tax=Mycena indigotica TaxID=2126181 RepID=A0A8H6RY91_9AGAR|nr:DUF1768 domain-containing protein [Mycena indigotica]KAF7289970.1 DUF1768 domain-containing protein [Mycena indigotica]
MFGTLSRQRQLYKQIARQLLTTMPRTAEDYTFFWSTNHVNGWASQWYKAPFLATVKMGDVQQEIRFLSNEHWMMFQKALLFNDLEIAKEVLSVEGTTKPDMAYVKSLGRRVSGFKEDVWVKHREQIVTEGTCHKFRQNEELKMKLFATGNTILVEASPSDSIWGIGQSEANALSSNKKWGLNLLGKALVVARETLREEDLVKSKRDESRK